MFFDPFGMDFLYPITLEVLPSRFVTDKLNQGFFLVSIVNNETRLNGYILTVVSRFSGALIFIFVDLFAFVIANLIQTYIAFNGYYKNKKYK